ncbi:hypothetical protein TIFTF001_001488 [Ficus carica]|uniref:Uncharacterized protein n=1 Tax=Ficus carica TaxID=3494 RepID=A0AA87Z6X4_FICCA|nr:hypothetical protein TIFTF001_001488 [Ficus carica]
MALAAKNLGRLVCCAAWQRRIKIRCDFGIGFLIWCGALHGIRCEVRELDPSLQTTRASPIFYDVAVAAASKASQTISVAGNSTFPSSIANSKACAFLEFWQDGDGGCSLKLSSSFSSQMAAVAAVIGVLGLGFD